jgi:meiotically up-regulated gene 157 (Mug157) protein
MIRADPYANAFNYEVQVSTDHVSDNSKRLLFGGIPFNGIFEKAIVFERKYEIDSLAAFLRLSN